MLKGIAFLLFAITFQCCFGQINNTQESDASVFTQEYTDDFQENFFEGLKQKGIENYDKAITYLLACNKAKPEHAVVSHELAKLYFLEQQYVKAQNFAVEALNSDYSNKWYLQTLVFIMQKQGHGIATISDQISYKEQELRFNLVEIYFTQKNYKAVLEVLKGLKKSTKKTYWSQKANRALTLVEEKKTTVSYSVTNSGSTENTMLNYKQRLKSLIRVKSYPVIGQVAKQAIEEYPMQAYFYYAQGFAFNKSKKYKNAAEILEAGLDLLVNDIALANKFYKELAAAYKGMLQTSKSNMYLRKIKPGF